MHINWAMTFYQGPHITTNKSLILPFKSPVCMATHWCTCIWYLYKPVYKTPTCIRYHLWLVSLLHKRYITVHTDTQKPCRLPSYLYGVWRGRLITQTTVWAAHHSSHLDVLYCGSVWVNTDSRPLPASQSGCIHHIVSTRGHVRTAAGGNPLLPGLVLAVDGWLC